MKSYLNLVYILTLVFLFNSCQEDPIDPVIINTVSEEFNITLWQQLGNIEDGYQMIIESQEEQICQNSLVDMEYNIEGSTITIQINGVSTDGPCIEGSALATTKIDLELPPGSYNIVVNLGSTIQNTGILELSEESISVDFDKEEGIQMDYKSMVKIPEGVAWGYIDYNVPDMELSQEMSQLILQNFAITATLYEGNYGHFRVGDNSSIEIDDAPDTANTYLFDIRRPDSWQMLKEIMQEWDSKFPDLKYAITRYNGLQIWN